jgi:hypothetical protein
MVRLLYPPLLLLVNSLALVQCQSDEESGEGEGDEGLELFGFPALTAILIMIGGVCGLGIIIGLIVWAVSCRSSGSEAPADFSLSGPSGFRHVSHVGRDHQNIDDIESIMGPSSVGSAGHGHGASGVGGRSGLALV